MSTRLTWEPGFALLESKTATPLNLGHHGTLFKQGSFSCLIILCMFLVAV